MIFAASAVKRVVCLFCKHARQIVERYKRKIANGESILPIGVFKNPGKDIYAVLDGHHRYYACLELGIKETKCAFAGDFSGLVFFMARYGFFYPAAEITEYILVVHMGVRYYVGKGQTFAFVLPKAENPVYRYIFHAYGMNNKKGKEKPALRMKTESMKNEDCKFKVLFVCTGNGYRSPICEALLKKLRPDLEVDSAGTKITSKITKEAREYLMSEDAVQYLQKKPESIDSKQVEQYDIIIAMEQRHKDSVVKKCPECKNKVVVWNIRDKIPFFHRRTEKINNQMKKNVTEYAGALA